MKDKWLDDISDKLSDFRQPVPPELWASIESSVPSRRRPAAVFFGIAAAIALLLGVGAVVLFLPQSDNNLTGTLDETASLPAQVVPAAPVRQLIADSSFPSRHKSVATNKVSGTSSRPETPETEEKLTPEPERESEKTTPAPDTTVVRRERFIISPDNKGEFYAELRPKKKRGGMEIALSVSNPGAKADFGSAGNILMSDALASGIPAFSPMTQIVLNTGGRESISRSKHHRPLSAGVSVSFPLTDRFRLTTGLVYSRLLSEFRTGNEEDRIATKQTLNYLGIPLRLTFDFWQNDRFRLYATGGGMIEKAVKGRAATEYFISNNLVSRETNSVSEHRPQFSVTAAAGGEMTLVRPVYLYAEPGLTFYIDNGSDVSNFYKDKPLDFSFQFGLRVRF